MCQYTCGLQLKKIPFCRLATDWQLWHSWMRCKVKKIYKKMGLCFVKLWSSLAARPSDSSCRWAYFCCCRCLPLLQYKISLIVFKLNTKNNILKFIYFGNSKENDQTRTINLAYIWYRIIWLGAVHLLRHTTRGRGRKTLLYDLWKIKYCCTSIDLYVYQIIYKYWLDIRWRKCFDVIPVFHFIMSKLHIGSILGSILGIGME